MYYVCWTIAGVCIMVVGVHNNMYIAVHCRHIYCFICVHVNQIVCYLYRY